MVGHRAGHPAGPRRRPGRRPATADAPASAAAAHLAFLHGVRRARHRRGARVRRGRPTTGLADLAALLDLDGPIPVRGYLAGRRHRPGAGPAAAGRDRSARAGWRPGRRRGDRLPNRRAHRPYTDCPGNSGVRYLTDEQIVDHLVACTIAGVQAGFHAIGDDAVTAVGRALTVGGRTPGRAEPRSGWRAARTGSSTPRWPTPRRSPRSPRTGTVASMQPMFDAAWGGPDGLYAHRLGTQRAARDERLRRDGRGRGRAGLRLRRAGDPGRALGRGAGGGASPDPG